MIITCLKCNRHVDTGTAVAGDVVKCRCGLGLMVPEGPPRQEVDTQKARKEGYIKCPVCQTIMNRMNFGRYSGVIIDICNKHGTWFDADELRRILDFIAAGGLDKAARREKEKLEEEIAYLKAKQRGDMEYSSVPIGGARTLYGRLNSERSALGIVGTLFRTLLK